MAVGSEKIIAFKELVDGSFPAASTFIKWNYQCAYSSLLNVK